MYCAFPRDHHHLLSYTSKTSPPAKNHFWCVGGYFTVMSSTLAELNVYKGRLLAVSLFLCQTTLLIPLAGAATYFVSPMGNDNNPGNKARPFKTLEKAKIVVRSIPKTEPINIYLRTGTYRLTQPLAFNTEDSGRPGAKVRWQIYPKDRAGTAVISGGRTLTGWTKTKDGNYQAKTQGLNFRQLYIQGKRMIRARTPNQGNYFKVKGDPALPLDNPRAVYSSYDAKNKRIGLSCADLKGVPMGAEQVIQHPWNQSRLRLAGYKCINNANDFAWSSYRQPEQNVFFDKVGDTTQYNGQPYHWEGAKVFLDSPGEWFLDGNKKIVYYRPFSGEKITQATVPVLETLVDIKGSNINYGGDRPGGTSPVHDLEFAGLVFQDSGWTLPDTQGYVGWQGGISFISQGGKTISGDHQLDPTANAFKLSFTKDILLENNRFQNLGGNGINLFLGNTRTDLVGNTIADVSGNCITVEGALMNSGDIGEQVIDNKILNNQISRCAQDYYGSVGIGAFFVDKLKIARNEIFDMPYTGISLGWGWTKEKTNLKNNLVSQNKIYDVMKLLNDGAGIYTLSKQPGTVIEKNWIRGIQRSKWTHVYPMAGIYLDNGSSGMKVTDNVLQGSTATRPQGGLPSVAVFTPLFQQTAGTPAQENTVSNNDKNDPALTGIPGSVR
jgi:Right handed beta helix region